MWTIFSGFVRCDAPYVRHPEWWVVVCRSHNNNNNSNDDNNNSSSSSSSSNVQHSLRSEFMKKKKFECIESSTTHNPQPTTHTHTWWEIKLDTTTTTQILPQNTGQEDTTTKEDKNTEINKNNDNSLIFSVKDPHASTHAWIDSLLGEGLFLRFSSFSNIYIYMVIHHDSSLMGGYGR